MKFSRTYALKEIADILSVDYIGADDFPVNGMNEIHVVEPGDIVFVLTRPDLLRGIPLQQVSGHKVQRREAAILRIL